MDGPTPTPGPRFDYSSGIPKRIEPEWDTPREPVSPPPQSTTSTKATIRMAIAGAFLLFCGVMNLVVGSVAALAAVVLSASEPEAVLRVMEKREPEQVEAMRARLKKDNATFDDIHRAYQGMATFFALGGLATGILGVVGGRALQTGQGYGLAMAGAVVNALPCISPCGCALLGPIFGMWCVLVLMQEETWQAFGRSRL